MDWLGLERQGKLRVLPADRFALVCGRQFRLGMARPGGAGRGRVWQGKGSVDTEVNFE
jgi:hypothetical protein